MTQGGREHSDPRGYFQLLFDPIFGLHFWGRILSTMASWAFNIVAAVMAFRVSGGAALAVGIVGAAQFLPQLFLAPLSGKLADRTDPTIQILLGRVLTALGAGSLAVFVVGVGGEDAMPGFWPVAAASFVVGLGLSLGGPAMQAIAPRLVASNEVGRAVVLNSMPMPMARAIGPALGTLIATALNPSVAFGTCALASVCHCLIVVRLRKLLKGSLSGSTGDTSVREAFRYVRRDTTLGVLLIGIASVSVGSDPAITLAPTIAHDLGGGDQLVGFLASSFGVGCAGGALAIGPLLRCISHALVGNLGLALMAAALLGISQSNTETAVAALFFACGIGMAFAYTCLTVRIQLRSPAHLRGRIMALWLAAFLGVRPIAATATGALSDTYSTTIGLWACAGVVGMAAALVATATDDRPTRL